MRKISAITILSLIVAFDASAACNVNAMNGVWTTTSASFVGEAHAGTCAWSIKNGAMTGSCFMEHPASAGGNATFDLSGSLELIGTTINDPGHNDNGFKVCQLKLVGTWGTGATSVWNISLGNGGKAFTSNWSTPAYGAEGVATGIKQ